MKTTAADKIEQWIAGRNPVPLVVIRETQQPTTDAHVRDLFSRDGVTINERGAFLPQADGSVLCLLAPEEQSGAGSPRYTGGNN